MRPFRFDDDIFRPSYVVFAKLARSLGGGRGFSESTAPAIRQRIIKVRRGGPARFPLCQLKSSYALRSSAHRRGKIKSAPCVTAPRTNLADQSHLARMLDARLVLFVRSFVRRTHDRRSLNKRHDIPARGEMRRRRV